MTEYARHCPESIRPDWHVSDNIIGLVTTRGEQRTGDPFASFNLALHVGDHPDRVAANREQLRNMVPGLQAIQWLQQVHGSNVISMTAGTAVQESVADAVYLRTPGYAGAVLTADCLPVFLASSSGDEAAVAHAGWRGLAAGILENTVQRFTADPAHISAWLGPAIGPCHFEVGEDVRNAFLEWARQSPAVAEQVESSFMVASSAGKWMADLYELAKLRLRAAGISQISGGGLCTVCDRDRFYSYRRDRVAGRMASLICIKPC
jgi:polyphenol oxidase